MSSLWTPDGEHKVPRSEDKVPHRDHGPTLAGGDGPQHLHASAGSQAAEPSRVADGRTARDRDDGALRAEMAEIERELVEAPVQDVVANHCYGLFQLAALHLGQSPPRLDDARLAIDALAAVVETLGDRLGGTATSLRDGLAQIRLAFVQIAGATRSGESAG
ncbi:MAG: hypothetical protein ACYCXY_08050 [Acidimicrobiales bacterium]